MTAGEVKRGAHAPRFYVGSAHFLRGGQALTHPSGLLAICTAGASSSETMGRTAPGPCPAGTSRPIVSPAVDGGPQRTVPPLLHERALRYLSTGPPYVPAIQSTQTERHGPVLLAVACHAG